MIDHNEKFLRTHLLRVGLGGPVCRAPRSRFELRTTSNVSEVSCQMCRRIARRMDREHIATPQGDNL